MIKKKILFRSDKSNKTNNRDVLSVFGDKWKSNFKGENGEYTVL